jgi:drug/metabolite transporter (DMT)-like permease
MRGAFFLILTGLLLGTTGIWTKLIGANVSPFLLTIFRTMLAAILIFVMVVLARNMKTMETLKIRKKDMLIFLITGFFGVAIGMGFYVKSFSFVPVANSVTLVFVYPVMTAILSWIFLKERITRLELAALVLVIMGVWSIYGSEINIASDAFGNALAIIAGLGYSVFIVSMRYFEEKGYKYWSVTFWPLMLGGVILALFLPFEPFAFSPSGFAPLYIAGIVLVTFFGYIFYAEGLKTIRAHDAVIITALTEPLAAMALAFVILGESIPQYVLVGAALIIAANVLVGIEFKKKHRKRHEAESKGGRPGFGWVW